MRVYSFAMTLCRDKNLAEEIAQETFCKALAAKKSAFRGLSDEVTWLCAIAKNVYYDEMRRRSRLGSIDPGADSGVGVESDILDADDLLHIHMALHSLAEPYREVFELRVFGELSFKQIAQIFGKTENWARVTYHRAGCKLRERMKDNE